MNNQDFDKTETENQQQEFCNQCPRHCPKDSLQCGRGRACFGTGDDSDRESDAFGRYGQADDRTERGRQRRERRDMRNESRRGPEGRYHGYGEWPGQPEGEASLSQLLCRCGHIAGQTDGRFRGQGRILHILSRQQEMSQKELQEAMQVEAGSLSEIMGKMEAKGILERKKDENDRRRMLVQLTEAGQRAAFESMQGTNTGDEMFRILSEEEQQQLRGLLEKLLNQWMEDFAKFGHGRQRGHRHSGDHHHHTRTEVE